MAGKRVEQDSDRPIGEIYGFFRFFARDALPTQVDLARGSSLDLQRMGDESEERQLGRQAGLGGN